MAIRTLIAGTGSCLPKRIVSNSDLEKIVDTSDEWITSRTGIKQRHISGQGEETSKLAAQAARQALANSGIGPEEIGLIVLGTISPEMSMPSIACLVQKEIGAVNAFAFDINAACSGFLFCLDLADKYVKNDPTLKILVIGAEALSTRTNWQDRGTCILFGDGAGACVVTSTTDQSRGIIASHLASDGRLWHILHMDGAASMNPDLKQENTPGPFIQMNGAEVFKQAVRTMEDAIKKVVKKAGIDIGDIDLVIPHQANIRIINSLIDRLAIGEEKFYINIHDYGNTSAASVPIAIDEANRKGILKTGDLVLLCAVGAGLTWGATLMRW